MSRDGYSTAPGGQMRRSRTDATSAAHAPVAYQSLPPASAVTARRRIGVDEAGTSEAVLRHLAIYEERTRPGRPVRHRHCDGASLDAIAVELGQERLRVGRVDIREREEIAGAERAVGERQRQRLRVDAAG